MVDHMKNYIIWLVGEVDGLFCALIVFSVMEFIASFFYIILEKKRHKKKWFIKYIFCEFGILMLVIISNIIDVMIFKNVTEIRKAVIYFYLVNKGLTIMDHLKKIGLPFPEILLKAIYQIKKLTM